MRTFVIYLLVSSFFLWLFRFTKIENSKQFYRVSLQRLSFFHLPLLHATKRVRVCGYRLHHP